MATRKETQELRELVKKRHKAANQKVSRLRAKGVSLEGTDLDPRRDLGKVKKYTVKQLKTYMAELNSFVSRKTSFAPGIKNRPLSGSLWNQHERLLKKYNAMTAAEFEQIKDIHLPTLGTTLEGFQAQKPLHPITGNPASRAPNIPVRRSSTGIPSNVELQKLIDDLKAKMTPEYRQRVLERNKETALKMLNPIADKEINESFSTLTDKQFSVLWDYTDFANMASFDYLIAQAHLHGNRVQAWQDAAADNQVTLMRAMIKDVKSNVKDTTPTESEAK